MVVLRLCVPIMHRYNDNLQNACFPVLQFAYSFTMQTITAAAGILRYIFTIPQIFNDIPAKKRNT